MPLHLEVGELYYYEFCFIASALLAITLIFKTTSIRFVDLVLFFIFAAVSNLGYWQRSISRSLEHAIFAQQLTYVGGCFATISIFYIILFLCKIKISKLSRLLMILFSSVVFASSFTIGKTTLFYKRVEMIYENGTYTFSKDYGIIPKILYIMIIVYHLSCFVALLNGIKRNKEVSIKTVTKLLVITTLGILAYFGSKFLLTIDLTPLWYVITGIILIVIQETIGVYDIKNSAADSILMQDSYGIVSFDSSYRFLGCNTRAKEIYPPLKNLIMDKKVDGSNYELKELESWIEFLQRNIKSVFYYKKNANYYKVESTPLYVNKKQKGYQLIFSDCTEEKQRESNLIKISITDELTKLYNRRAFEEEIEKIQSDGIPEDFTILSFDLNGLKAANDTKGHAAGDELIIESAKTLNAVIESYGYVYRTGGDEYIAITICSKEQQEEIFSLIDNYSKLWKGTYSTGLSISKGAASITEFPDYSIDQLEKEAEQRMYKDKTRYYIESGIERRKR